MSSINDYKLSKKDASPRVQQIIDEIVEILNNGGYEQKRYAAVPTVSDPGFEGEARMCITGNVLTNCFYSGGFWYKSDSTAASGYSKIT